MYFYFQFLRKEEYYFDSDGNKVTDGNGVHKVVNEYDSDGNLLAKELFALPDQGGIWGNSNVHCVKRTWANGNVTSEEYYAPDGTQAADNNGVTEKKFHYKKNGLRLDKYFYADGRTEVLKMKNLVKAAIVLSDSPGAAKGVQAGDLILNFAGADWTNGNFNLAANIQRVRYTEKTHIFARKNPDGSFKIFSVTFPSGVAGISINDYWIDITDYKKIMETYKKIKKK